MNLDGKSEMLSVTVPVFSNQRVKFDFLQQAPLHFIGVKDSSVDLHTDYIDRKEK